MKNIEDVVLDITVLNVVVNIHLQRYIDTENSNQYIADNVGKCNHLDKCGYHYTPKQYFEDNPWLKDNKCSFFQKHREKERTNTEHRTPPPPIGYISEAVRLGPV